MSTKNQSQPKPTQTKSQPMQFKVNPTQSQPKPKVNLWIEFDNFGSSSVLETLQKGFHLHAVQEAHLRRKMVSHETILMT